MGWLRYVCNFKDKCSKERLSIFQAILWYKCYIPFSIKLVVTPDLHVLKMQHSFRFFSLSCFSLRLSSPNPTKPFPLTHTHTHTHTPPAPPPSHSCTWELHRYIFSFAVWSTNKIIKQNKLRFINFKVA